MCIRDSPVRLGLGPGLGRRDHRRRVLRDVGPRDHRRLPPLFHPRLVQGQPAAEDLAGRCRQMSLQGPVIIWVADHRRHHAFSDREGDPHSPWLYGTSMTAVARGFWHAHMGWLFERDMTNQQRFAPDLLADRDVARVNSHFIACTVITLGAPALIGGLVTWSWWGALTAFFWASLV